jgi:hypothetical protein
LAAEAPEKRGAAISFIPACLMAADTALKTLWLASLLQSGTCSSTPPAVTSTVLMSIGSTTTFFGSVGLLISHL